ncbi:MAG TPA: hypothetical protein VK206_11050 [Anaerolineales bacterium]|nr:hypothetical protein [Anaerolineales bacterium]
MNRSLSFRLLPFLRGTAMKRGVIFGLIILSALLAFEVFNYSSTLFALTDILGDLAFGPLRWATILAFAFCGIDFAGIARIFTPEQGRDEPAEVWYLFAAWFLAAAFNASLTWWGVSVAVLNHNAAGGALLGQPAMVKVVPVFVAAMVLIIRVLLINTFSIAGDRIFSFAENRSSRYQSQPSYRTNLESLRTPNEAPSFPRPAPKPTPAAAARPLYNEPTYHPVGMSAQERNENPNVRR